MEDIKKLEEILIEKLEEIRKKDKLTLNDREEYKKTQEQLREVHRVVNYIKTIVK